MRLSIRSERGVTGIEILVAIAALLLIVAAGSVILYFVASHDLEEKNICLIQLDKVSSQVQLWSKTTTPTNPTGDRSVCTSAKDLVDKYNKQCGERLGRLPVPTCE